MKEIEELKNMGTELFDLNNVLKQYWNELSPYLPMLNSELCYIGRDMQVYGLEKLSEGDANTVSDIMNGIKNTQDELNTKGQIFLKKQVEVLEILEVKASECGILKDYVTKAKNDFQYSVGYGCGVNVLENFSKLIEDCQRFSI